MSQGLGSAVYELKVAPNGFVYATGTFTSASGLTVRRIAKWNGSSWTGVDVTLPGAPTKQALGFGPQDPVIPSNYDAYMGFTTTGAGSMAGDVTVTNAGTSKAFPIVTISRAGGTSAQIVQLRNETLGLEIGFNYNLLDGETLTLDFRPQVKNIESSHFGRRTDAILPNSDFGEFHLTPGTNVITLKLEFDGTITTHMKWIEQYNGVD